nr:Gfo/Idh/MocA family oxidoreductase [bacterium]
MSRKAPGIGLIGFGWMGQSHTRAFRNIEVYFPESDIRPRLVAMADPVSTRVATAVEDFGYEKGGADWREVVHHPDVDIVDITAPNALHRTIAEEAAAAGKTVFCEKPVGGHPEDTMAIARAIRTAGVLSGCGYNYRWVPLVQHVHTLIQEGRFGRLTHYRGRFFSMYGRDPLSLLTWRFTEKSRYGTLTDIMSHAIDMALFLCGPIRRVVATRETFITHRPIPMPGNRTHYDVGSVADPTGQVTNEDYVGALVEFENGARGTLESDRTIVGPQSDMAFELNGTKGAASWTHEKLNALELYLPEEQPVDGFVQVLAGDWLPHQGNIVPGHGNSIGYEALKLIELYEFLQAVGSGATFSPDFEAAARVAQVQAAMARSWESGAWESVGTL